MPWCPLLHGDLTPSAGLHPTVNYFYEGLDRALSSQHQSIRLPPSPYLFIDPSTSPWSTDCPPNIESPSFLNDFDEECYYTHPPSTNVTVEYHIRYLPPSASRYLKVELPPPEVYKDRCDAPPASVFVDVPVGDGGVRDAVAAALAIAVGVGTAVILISLR